jgi:predicted dehydrogenase
MLPGLPRQRSIEGDTLIDAAIVGLGRWGRNLVEAVQGRSRKLRFVQAVVRNPEAARAFAAEKGLALTTDLAHVQADEGIPAVVFATPHSLHAQQVVAAAAAGKAVFCEKPLALTREDAALAVSACRRAGVVLAVGHDKRFWPSMQALARVVASGELGQILHIEGHFSNESTGRYYEGWRASEVDSPGGGLTAMGVHILDAFVGLAGAARRVQAHVVKHPPAPDPVDTLTLFMEFANGASGVMCAVRTSPSYWRVHVFGKDASCEAVGPTSLTVRRTDAQPEHFAFEPVSSLRAELEAFADAVTGVAPYPITPRDMIHGVALLEAAIRSFDSGKEVHVES